MMNGITQFLVYMVVAMTLYFVVLTILPFSYLSSFLPWSSIYMTISTGNKMYIVLTIFIKVGGIHLLDIQFAV